MDNGGGYCNMELSLYRGSLQFLNEYLLEVS